MLSQSYSHISSSSLINNIVSDSLAVIYKVISDMNSYTPRPVQIGTALSFSANAQSVHVHHLGM